MPPVAAETAHHAPAIVVICAALLVGLGVVVPAALALRRTLRTRRALRRCPRCGARAVSHATWGSAGNLPARVALQCGQCATWRRVFTDDADRRAQRRRMKRDRLRIQRRLDVLRAERRQAEVDAFIALLHEEIAGAPDFLTRTRLPTPARRGRG